MPLGAIERWRMPRGWKSILGVGVIALAGAAPAAESSCQADSLTYCNPLVGNFADPGVFKETVNGVTTYYFYGSSPGNIDDTPDAAELVKFTSTTDFKTFTDVVRVLDRPSWACDDCDASTPDSQASGSLAPELAKANGRYVLFFATKNKKRDICISAAESSSPAGPFTPIDINSPRAVYVCENGSFDQHIFKDPAAPKASKWWLYWGSLRPIVRRQLDPDDITKFATGSSAKQVITKLPNDPSMDNAFGPGIEASYVIYRNNMYYMFLSGSFCCGGDEAYQVWVARSSRPDGGFTYWKTANNPDIAQKIVRPDLDSSTDQRWVAPGHNSIFTDADGNDWIVYHARRPTGATGIKQRALMMDRLLWTDDGWPHVENYKPSTTPQPLPRP